MPTSTYTPIANVTFGATTASATFSSVSQAYRDIIVIVNNLANTGDLSVRLQFNNDTGTNYPFQQMYGSGSSTFANADTLDGILGSLNNVGGWGQSIFHIMDYSTTDKHKTVIMNGGVAAIGVRADIAKWNNTSAITTIKVLTDGNSFVAGSSIGLYGIAA